MTSRLTIYALVGAALVGLAGFAWFQTGRLADMRLERDAAVAALESAQRAIDELAVERAAADRRASIAQSAREAILTAPSEDDGEVAPVLARALRAADDIGGLNE